MSIASLLSFTLPKDLGPVARSHPLLLYHLLLGASDEAVRQLAQDEQRIGAVPGKIIPERVRAIAVHAPALACGSAALRSQECWCGSCERGVRQVEAMKRMSKMMRYLFLVAHDLNLGDRNAFTSSSGLAFAHPPATSPLGPQCPIVNRDLPHRGDHHQQS